MSPKEYILTQCVIGKSLAMPYRFLLMDYKSVEDWEADAPNCGPREFLEYLSFVPGVRVARLPFGLIVHGLCSKTAKWRWNIKPLAA